MFVTELFFSFANVHLMIVSPSKLTRSREFSRETALTVTMAFMIRGESRSGKVLVFEEYRYTFHYETGNQQMAWDGLPLVYLLHFLLKPSYF